MEHVWLPERTALVVDDDAFILSALAEVLSEDGYDVHIASNGFSALRQAIELRPTVMLLDLVLPERSGQDILRDLRADPATRDMAIVVVTGHAECLNAAQLTEIDGLVAKPFDLGDLLVTVQRAVQRAAGRRAEVPPVMAALHRDAAGRSRYPTGIRRSRGRR